jgi:hypothetical protein
MAVQDQDDDGAGGVKEMAESVRNGWLDSIESLTTLPAADDLWKRIAQACTESGDIASYEVLKTAMAKKRKAIAAQGKEAQP